jgi:hypothetical protein
MREKRLLNINKVIEKIRNSTGRTKNLCKYGNAVPFLSTYVARGHTEATKHYFQDTHLFGSSQG